MSGRAAAVPCWGANRLAPSSTFACGRRQPTDRPPPTAGPGNGPTAVAAPTPRKGELSGGGAGGGGGGDATTALLSSGALFSARTITSPAASETARHVRPSSVLVAFKSAPTRSSFARQ